MHARARALAEHLRLCTSRAIAAVRAGDTPALTAQLRQRTALIDRLGPLLASCAAAASRASDESRGDLLASLRATRTLDADLTAELERRRDEAATALDGLSRRERGGYSAAQPRARPRIDERR